MRCCYSTTHFVCMRVQKLALTVLSALIKLLSNQQQMLKTWLNAAHHTFLECTWGFCKQNTRHAYTSDPEDLVVVACFAATKIHMSG